ncbi:uncharacterized protein CEXT_621551 [Caerostris extrusa]|uniref:Uncharacterized protein n=1 Tax=Caerostris extrusa TaxID=172846 RepID=A0AAV4XDD6_CAEEX|nr:uncharacterized protein CEXT_621551 [Caerostris extrusa]
MTNNSKDMQNMLSERNMQVMQIKEIEVALRKELLKVQQEAENREKDAEERILKCESEANIKLEEFQESLYVRIELENLTVSIKDFLKTVFPNLNIPENMENKESLTKYELEVKSYLEELKSEKSHDSKDTENLLKKLEIASQEKVNLESQIKLMKDSTNNSPIPLIGNNTAQAPTENNASQSPLPENDILQIPQGASGKK